MVSGFCAYQGTSLALAAFEERPTMYTSLHWCMILSLTWVELLGLAAGLPLGHRSPLPTGTQDFRYESLPMACHLQRWPCVSGPTRTREDEAHYYNSKHDYEPLLRRSLRLHRRTKHVTHEGSLWVVGMRAEAPMEQELYQA